MKALNELRAKAEAACQDTDIWASVELPGFDPADREYVAAANPQVVLALLDALRRNAYKRDRAAVREIEEGSPKRPDDSDT